MKYKVGMTYNKETKTFSDYYIDHRKLKSMRRKLMKGYKRRNNNEQA